MNGQNYSMRRPAWLTAILLMAVSLNRAVISSAQDEWPQFRGPDGQGHTEAIGLPITWSETENVVWKTATPGEGHSSPVISENQIWLTTAITKALAPEEEKERLAKLKNSNELKLSGALTLQAICVNRESGVIEKTIDLFEVSEPEPKHSLNSYASPTPVISGDKLFCHFGTYGTAAIDRNSGNILWKNDSLKIDHQNGPGSSPVVWHDKVIIHFDGMDDQFIAALDANTGEVAWRTSRSGEMDKTPELKKAYGTPLLLSVKGRMLVISPAANWVYAYDADTGSEVWKAAYGQLGFSTVPRPVASDDTVYIATSYMQSRLVAVRFDGEGDVTETHITWKSDKQIPQKPSLILCDNRLYFVSDRGIVRCVNPTTGKDIWFERLSGDYSASPIESEGHLYFCGQNGTCTVLQAGAEYKELAKNTLEADFMASPAVAGKALFLRSTTHLYRIEQR
ncbi:MAG TPA: PQQ-binding-like beta-propeller repeat protein [Planctomycetaceae bacterium]|nr:PQQ-binding-like beta-propeller repeat protein [Planctomycetaceae bacterium]